MARKRPEDFEHEESQLVRRLADMIRREAVAADKGALSWTLRGPADEEGESADIDHEVMQGLGYLALPDEGEEVEAVVVNVEGDPDHSVVVAARAPRTARSVLERVQAMAGDRLLYTREAIVRLVNDGIVYLGKIGVDFSPVALGDHTHQAPAITGQAQYVDGPTARTGGPDRVSENVKVN